MQQLAICHGVVSLSFSLNLEIVDHTKEGGEIVGNSYRCSNPQTLERHSTSSEEAAVPERHPDPQSYISARHICLID